MIEKVSVVRMMNAVKLTIHQQWDTVRDPVRYAIDCCSGDGPCQKYDFEYSGPLTVSGRRYPQRHGILCTEL